MKNLFGMIILSGFLLACGSANRNSAKSYSLLPPDEPTYMKDQRVERNRSSQTESHGSSNPGNGGSFASTGYRSEALKELNDTLNISKDNLEADNEQ